MVISDNKAYFLLYFLAEGSVSEFICFDRQIGCHRSNTCSQCSFDYTKIGSEGACGAQQQKHRRTASQTVNSTYSIAR